MASSKEAADYDALEATTSIEDMTDNEDNQWTLRSLKNNDKDLSRLRLCSSEDSHDRDVDEVYGDYFPGSCEELGWLGHFAKKSPHLEEFLMYESNIFKKCSEESVDRFFGDLGKCNHIKKMGFSYVHLSEIICKLGPVIEKKNNITHLHIYRCFFGPLEANHLFNVLRDMTSLEELCVSQHDYMDDDNDQRWTDLDDDVMTGCIPSLAALTGVQKLELQDLSMGIKSSAALGAVLPRMAGLLELALHDESIDGNFLKVLVRGLAECKRLHTLDFIRNRIGDDGLEVLIQGLPASVNELNLEQNRITLDCELPPLRFKKLLLSCNPVSLAGPGVIAASLANQECRLERLDISYSTVTNIGDEDAAILATSLRNNRRLTHMILPRDIFSTELGWKAFRTVLCDTASINATHASNHTLQDLGAYWTIPKDIRTMLHLNYEEDKSHVAATKILQSHRHLDMRPLFEMNLDLLPRVVVWLDRFAESRLDLKLSSIFEFARAMPMDVIDGVTGKKKGKKRRLNNA